MKNEAVEKIKSILAPKVTIQAAYDVPGGIVAEVKHEYYIQPKDKVLPIPLAKLIRVHADKDGNVFKTEGLF